MLRNKLVFKNTVFRNNVYYRQCAPFTISSKSRNRNAHIVKSKYKDVVVPKVSVSEHVWQDLDKWSEKIAVVCALTGKGYTYSNVYKMSNNLAANLRGQLKLDNGDKVAILMPNCPDYPVVVMGIISAGCVVTTINPAYKVDEVQRQLQQSEAKAIITIPNSVHVIKQAMEKIMKKLPIIVVRESGEELPNDTIDINQFTLDANLDNLKGVRCHSNDTVLLPYSSGTTGLPKGVELSNNNLIANCLQMHEKAISHVNKAIGDHQDKILCIMPFFHVSGLSIILYKMAMGCQLVTLPKFEPKSFLTAQATNKTHVIYIAPPLLLFLGTHPGLTEEHFESLRVIMCAAAPIAINDIYRLLDRSKNKFNFVQGYGLTETSPALIHSELGNKNLGSVGSPVPNTEIKVVSVESGIALGAKEVGELQVRGPQVMKGYHNKPKANAEVFVEDNWFRTGDIGYYDENHHFYIVDRLKELIKVKGFQVAPAELEGTLRDHESVSEAAVIGIPHARWGEAPKAYVVLKEGHSATKETILKFVEERVAPYKKIIEIEFVEGLPKNPSGKIQRKQLKDLNR